MRASSVARQRVVRVRRTAAPARVGIGAAAGPVRDWLKTYQRGCRRGLDGPRARDG